MAPTIIYFIKKGSKIKNSRGKNITAKHSRLHVGWCLRDWTKVFYQPTSDELLDDDEAAMPAKYGFLTSEGTKRREPAEGEIAWLPHFDPVHIQNKFPKERNAIHKQTLNDAWTLLDADDDVYEELKEKYTDEKHRRWDSWFVEAVKWKDSRTKRRSRRLTRRQAAMHRIGDDPNTAHSDTSTDSAYESEGDDGGGHGLMGPPSGRLQRVAQPNGRSSAGNRARPNGAAKRRREQSPPSSPSDGSNMSLLGRRRLAQSSHARGRPSGMFGQPGMYQQDSSDDGGIFMSGGRGSDPPGGLLRNARRGSVSSRDRSVNGEERLLSEVSEVYDTRPPEGGTPPARTQGEAAWMPEHTIAAYQGDIGEEEALDQAIRASEPPEALPTPRPTGNEPRQTTDSNMRFDFPDLGEAIEASRILENQPPQPTAEDNGEVDVD